MIQRIKDWIFWKYFSDYARFEFEIVIKNIKVSGDFYDNWFNVVVNPQNFRRKTRVSEKVRITGDAYRNRIVL